MRPPAAVLILAAATAFATCGGEDAPHGPGPSPSPSVNTTPGPVVGRFLLRITPAASCNIGGSVSLPMLAAAAGASPYPGVQVLIAGGGDPLELELMSVAQAVRGGFGTTERGALGDDGTRLWIRAIGSGPLVRSADGRGEVTTGQLAGYVSFGFAAGPEGSLGACDSVDHTFTLRATP